LRTSRNALRKGNITMKRIYLNTTKTIMNKLLFRIALFGLVLSATVHAQQGRAQVNRAPGVH
jgi:hypothetical protein